MWCLSAINKKWKRSVFVNFTIGLVVTLIANQPVFAAYDRVVTWSDMSSLDLLPVLRSQYSSHGNLYDPIVSDSDIELALNNMDDKVSQEFKIPSEIKPSVRFWLKVYAKYSTRNIVIFDSNNLNIVYEVYDLKELIEKSKNQIVYEIVSKQKIEKLLASYHKAFEQLSVNPHPKKPTREQKIILEKIKNVRGRHNFRELNHGLKFMRGQRDNVIKGLLAAEAYFPLMESIFSKFKVPPELTRLSLVESSFDLKATSKVGASGVWQFMPSIGKKYLTINDKIKVDERRSPLKATVAAAKLLQWNYKYLGSWVLAIISYNHGLKNLPRLKPTRASFAATSHLFSARTSPGRSKPLLGWASRSYYSEFLAVLYAESYRSLFFGEIPITSLKSVSFEQMRRPQTALNYALEKSISLNEFRFLNSDIQDIHQILPKGFLLVVPNDIAKNNLKLTNLKSKKNST